MGGIPFGRGDVSSRFEFALKALPTESWIQFEKLSAEFLADDFPEFRTTANQSGDGGRDGHLFVPSDEDSVAIQASVTSEWESKIRNTVARLANTHPSVQVLIYVTPHRIGAQADELVAELRGRNRVHLDVRDSSWFVERENKSMATAKAAEWFSDFVVGRIADDETLIDHSAAVLDDEETRAALVFLVLQRADDSLDRQLTKQCFDALVRSVLRDTSNENRMSRSEVHQHVAALLPSHPANQIAEYADLALARLEKRYIRLWTAQDEFCLTYEERERVAEEKARLRLADAELDVELHTHARFVAEPLGLDLSVVDQGELTTRFRRVLEELFFQRGETFVESLESGEEFLFREDEIEVMAERDLANNPDKSSLRGGVVALVTQTLTRVLLNPGDQVRAYLRGVADAYTLWAFMRETANVQSAVSKLFSQGDIWLDTSALLPLLAEELLEESERHYTQLIQGVHSSGARTYVTEGVVEELDAHIRNCVYASRSPTTWTSRTPFVLAAHIWAGERNEDFVKWINVFRGRHRPKDDLIEYLEEVHGITFLDLAKEYETANEKLRWHTDEYWRRVHQKRREADAENPTDPQVIEELASHDAVTFVGVLERRAKELVGSAFGYRTWWLTLDGAARGAHKRISEDSGFDISSPVMTFEFLSNYLVVGPARRQLSKAQAQNLPVLNDTSLIEGTPDELLAVADDARQRMAGQDGRLRKRFIRDTLDQEKLRGSRVRRTTVEAMEDDIRAALQAARPKSRANRS